MASLKDIAKICEVSTATVSKALNNHKDIGDETKEKIKKVAKELGYLPNSSARALKTNRTYNLGVLFADDANSGLQHDYFASILNSFKRTAEKQGYDITFVNNCKDRPNRMSYLEHCKYRGFDGIALVCVDFTSPEVIELLQADIPLVTVDYVSNGKTSIVSDNIKGMRDLVSFVIAQGHEKIAYITGDNNGVTSHRLTSFYRTCEQHGIQVPDDYVKQAAYRDTDSTYRFTKELLTMENPPTCILFPDDYSSLGGINAIRELGLKIPEDISIAGYDGVAVSRLLEPQLTTLAQDTEQLGSVAANELLELIEHPKTALIQMHVISGNVVPGKSVAFLKK